MWEIIYYETPNGDCPYKEFLDGLHPKTELPHVKHEMDMLEELGNLLPRPHAALLRDGIYELRPRANKKQFRCLYFFHHKDQIVITHGIIKKGNTKYGDAMPPKEIEKAIAARTDYRKRNP